MIINVLNSILLRDGFIQIDDIVPSLFECRFVIGFNFGNFEAAAAMCLLASPIGSVELILQFLGFV